MLSEEHRAHVQLHMTALQPILWLQVAKPQTTCQKLKPDQQQNIYFPDLRCILLKTHLDDLDVAPVPVAQRQKNFCYSMCLIVLPILRLFS